MSGQDHKQALPAGYRLRTYRVLRVLGAGGFGVTYLCEHAGLGVQVAVKEYLPNEIAVRDGAAVHPKSAGDREGFEWGLSRFLDEARTLARFEHPNVVRVRDCFEANRTAYIVMDYEDGESLSRLLQRWRTLTEAQLKRVVLPVADGLRHVHASGFLHRDVKPSNIFVRRSGESPVLLDFGSARYALGRKSRSMTAVASAGYSPPEQYESRGDQGAWTDIYALSALCYRAITGKVPVEAPRRTGELARSRADPQVRLATSGALARFEHRNVVRVRDCFEAHGTAYIVMDYEDGESLAALLEHHGTLTETQLKRVVLPVADGLRQVHAAGFLHRDIKPSNIFVRRSDESPVLLDFGSARQALGRKSRSMTAIASAGYSPPEQYESQGDQGAWTDIYALSALCYRAITGKMPVEAPRRTSELVRSRADPQARLVASGGTGYSSGLLEAVDWGLRLIETDRPQSLDDWLAQMQGAVSVRTLPSLARASQGLTASHLSTSTRSAGLGRKRSDASAPSRRESDGAVERADDVVSDDFLVAEYSVGAERGNAAAQLHLGVRYYHGEGVPRDAGQALLWFRRAAEQGDAAAQWWLGYMCANGDGTPKDAGEAAHWYRKAAVQGNRGAQCNLGALYYRGEGVPRDVYEAALWYRKAAENGVAVAQLQLGDMYRTGEGVPQDALEAWLCYSGAAEQGYAAAQYELGLMYANGEGVPKDIWEAARWYCKAAEQGHAEAQNSLGVCYADGKGVPKDVREAVRWVRKAAEQGLAGAQNNLGVCYADGKGVPKDAREAARWYRKAAEQGHAAAQNNLGIRYAVGDGVPKDAREAARWHRKAAEQGHAEAENYLGVCYAGGKGVPKDAREAARWHRKAAEQGLAEAQNNLGVCYAEGKGVPKDAREAVRWYRKAAEQGLAQAQSHLGSQYADGNGVSRDAREAARWYRRAAEQGHATAQNDLGLAMLRGDGVPKDAREAARWVRKAAEQGLAAAQNNLGVFYADGKGVPKDGREAVRWYRKAAEQGLAQAQSHLGSRYAGGRGVPRDAREAARWLQGRPTRETKRHSLNSFS